MRHGVAGYGPARQGKGAEHMKKKESERNRVAMSNLKQATATHQRGDVANWGVIESAIGGSREESWVRSLIRRWRNEVLRERGIAMRPIPGVGMRFLHADEQVDICCVDRRRRMSRQAMRAIREVASSDSAQLDDHHKVRQLLQVRALRDERSKINFSIRGIVGKVESVRRGISPQG